MATIERPLRTLPERRGGVNKKLATIVLTGAIAAGGIGIWAATNQGEQNKPEPTPAGGVGGNPSPEATQTPVVTITPTETPVVTPEPTPIPTPEATPMPISSILEGDNPKVAVKTITSGIKTTLENNPEVLTDGWTQERLLELWNFCQKGDPDLGGNPYTNKQLNCQNVITKFYQDYQKLNDENFYKVAKEVYGYAANNLPDEYVDNLNSNLKQFFP